MKTRAAVALEKGKPLTVMDVELDGPKVGEVLVEVKATGICHTDDFTLSGADPESAAGSPPGSAPFSTRPRWSPALPASCSGSAASDSMSSRACGLRFGM